MQNLERIPRPGWEWQLVKHSLLLLFQEVAIRLPADSPLPEMGLNLSDIGIQERSEALRL